MAKPLCFMIGPYGRKPTNGGSGAPLEIDFDALWDRALAPTVHSMGYEPTRADMDTGGLILHQMFRRLSLADLVLADLTIPNGNVYYEVGVRHALRRDGCVLLAANWARQLFDVAQMRMVRYPLPEGDITEQTARMISAAIRGPIEALARGISPVFESVHGHNSNAAATAFGMNEDDFELAIFRGQVKALRALPHAQRMARAKQLVEEHWKPPVTPATAQILFQMLKDSANTADDWIWITHFTEKFPPNATGLEELYALALSQGEGKQGDAIARVEAVIDTSGPTVERLGLLGSLYKQLLRAAETEQERLRFLNLCIGTYERGLDLDLNEYDCSSNLPRLYRQRKRRGDEERYQTVSRIVMAACEREKRRGAVNERLRLTLLGAAFDAGDVEKAEELAEEVAAEGAARWKLDSLLEDLQLSVAQVEDGDRRDRLAAILKTFAPGVAA